MRRSFLALLAALLAVSVAWPLLRSADAAPAHGRVVVLGFDGGDYRTAAAMAADGRMPNLAALAQEGTFAPLGTTWSAESPVAWAALNTGQNPSKTGVPGFVKRILVDRDYQEVPANGDPLPSVGHQKNESRPVRDMEAGLLIDTLARFDATTLTLLVGAVVLIAFLIVFKGLLRLKLGLSLVMSLALGIVGALGARYAKGYVPEEIPKVVGNPVEVDSFWEIAARQGLRAVVLDAAMAWDRPQPAGSQVLGGLGLPDCRGDNGQWFVYTTDDLEFEKAPKGRSSPTAGTIFKIDNWRNDKISSFVYGPANFHAIGALQAEMDEIDRQLAPENDIGWQEGNRLRERKKELKTLVDSGAPTSVPLELERKGDVVTVSMDGHAQDLREGVWSDWYAITFEINPLIKAHAVTRVKILNLDDPFTLFVNTLDIDPQNPQFWQPVSQPREFSAELAQRAGGAYETFGWACATMPFKDRVIDAETMLEDIEFTMKWRERLTKDALARDDWDVLMTVFSTPDRVQHMCYQFYDPQHPLYDEAAASRKMTFFDKEIELRDAIPTIYEQIDRIIGYVRAALGPDDTLLVCADHGFQSFRYQVNLNNWLEQKGYLKLRDGLTNTKQGNMLGYVDWSQTRAYAMGLGMIFLNLEGRERQGIVKPGDAHALLEEIRGELLKLEDPREGSRGPAVETVTLIDEVHQGPFRDREGDLMVGFKPNYRVSWDTTSGDIKLVKDASGAIVSGDVFADNKSPWSGGHVSVAPQHVPGIFASNKKIALPQDGAHLLHIAPTTLKLLGVDAPAASDREALDLSH
ncbi:MAG: alkaline phosphatase family protein [Planctomycetes bacterium]|nr:alkaline phosphatase family protein [Planctomycetota bacterium]